jgi:peptidoglycan L-alanyl-D-glutamate endopeptidase CwlK
LPSFSQRSLERRAGVHPDLCRLADRAVLRFDCTVLHNGGVRSPELQLDLYNQKLTKTLDSKHLMQMDGWGHALDLAPWWPDEPHVRWPGEEGISEAERIERWRRWSAFGGYMMGLAEWMGINVRWGQDWDRDWNFAEHSFIDSPHWELLR